MPLQTALTLLLNITLLLVHLLALTLLMARQSSAPDRPALALWLVSSILWLVALGARQIGVAGGASLRTFELLNNFAYGAFGLVVMTTFALVVTAAGAMRDALLTLTRTGYVVWFVLQLPLWRGDLLPHVQPSPLGTRTDLTTPQGLFAAFVLLGWGVLTLAVAFHYRAQFTRRPLVIGLLAWQGIGVLAQLSLGFREAGIITWAVALPLLLALYDVLRGAATHPEPEPV